MNDLAKNSAILLSANVVAQAVGLLVYPILSRLYLPEDFGLLNLFLSLGGILVILSSLELQYAIVLPSDERKAVAVWQNGMFSVLAFTLILLLSSFFAPAIASLFDAPKFAFWYRLLPAYVLFSATWNLLNYYYTRERAFTAVSSYQFSLSLFSAGGKLAFGLLGLTACGLILPSILAPLLALLVSFGVFSYSRYSPNTVLSRSFPSPFLVLSADSTETLPRHYRDITPAERRQAWSDYVDFPKFYLPKSLLNMLALQLPVLWFTPVFGSTAVGYWGMAVLLSFTPIQLITRTLYQVLYQRVSAAVNDRTSIASYFRLCLLLVVSVGLPIAGLLYFILPWLVTILLGPGWEPVAEIIRWLLPTILVSLFVSSMGFVIAVFSRQRTGLFFECLLALGRFCGIAIGVYYYDFMLSVAGYCVLSALVNTLQGIWFWLLVARYERSL